MYDIFIVQNLYVLYFYCTFASSFNETERYRQYKGGITV